MDCYLPEIFSPPDGFDLDWRTDADGIPAAVVTPVFAEAFRGNVRFFERNGFRVSGRPEIVTWRRQDMIRTSQTVAGNARKALARIEANARIFVERAAIEAERRRPLQTAEIAGIQNRLRLVLSSHEWVVPRRLHDTASALIEAEALTTGQARFAREIAEEAEARLARIDARLASPAGEDAMAKVRRKTVRLALSRAVRAITARDEDRAVHRNNVGWDAASSDMGHRLAWIAEYDERTAAHAWTLVHRHRRQISGALWAELYGSPDIEDEPVVAPAA